MENKIITVEFEDRGQDFLEWDIAFDDSYSLGKVVDCRPFQKDIWDRYYVLSGKPEEKQYLSVSLAPGEKVSKIQYPIIKVTEKQ